MLKKEVITLVNCEVYSDKAVSLKRAQEMAQFYEEAYKKVGEDLGGYASKKMKLYVYSTQKNLVKGLQRYSGFSYESAKFFSRGGAPRPMNYKMHLPPSADFRFIVHEYTHCVIEELSDNIYKKVKWLDEGLASFEGFKYGEKGKLWPYALVNYAIQSGEYIPLNKISSESSWVKNMKAGKTELIYYEALMAIEYFLKNNDISDVIKILKMMKERDSQKEAFTNTIGIDLITFEKELKKWLINIQDPIVQFARKESSQSIIQVDGIDSDWKNINPIIEDPPNDAKIKFQGTDIKNISLFRDKNFLYVMYRSYAADSGKMNPIAYTFYIDDNIDEKKFNIRYQPGALSKGTNWFWYFPKKTNYKDRKNLYFLKDMKAEWGIKPNGMQIFEMKIPVSQIKCVDKFRCYFGTFIGGKMADLTDKVVYSAPGGN